MTRVRSFSSVSVHVLLWYPHRHYPLSCQSSHFSEVVGQRKSLLVLGVDNVTDVKTPRLIRVHVNARLRTINHHAVQPT